MADIRVTNIIGGLYLILATFKSIIALSDIFCCKNGYPGRMEPGVTFTVEPAISEGSPQVRT